MKIAAIVLAAGGSTRMGSPKQLLMFDGRPLLVRAVDAVRALRIIDLTVVLGASARLTTPVLSTSMSSAESRLRPEGRYPEEPGSVGVKVNIVTNPDWSTGMGSSIRVGVAAVLGRSPDLDAILITLCDQPRVGTASLSKLIERFEQNDCPAVAAGYSGTVGVPAVFGPLTFDALRSLSPAGGAKSILSADGAAVVPIPEAAVDVDTPEDFARLSS